MATTNRRRHERRQRLEQFIEETEEELDGTDTGSFDELVAEADVNTFDATFLATADDWRIAEPTPSPAPFPLQVVPRLGYVISYQMVYDDSIDEWVPKKKGNLIDDFEDGNLAEYNITAQDGTIGIVSDPVFEGEFAIEVSSNAGTSRIQSVSGLDNYPQQGDRFAAKHRFNNLDSLGGLMFGVQSASTGTNFYDLLIAPARNELRIRKDRSPIASTPVNFTSADTGTWLDLLVNWRSNGVIEGQLLNEDNSVRATVRVVDTTYTSGGIGYRQNADALGSVRSFFDQVEIVP